jgi:shikimate kinase
MYNMKIFLIGMMGAGKTTVGKLLADELQIPSLDLDEEIEHVTGKVITDIFEQNGEIYFRQVERDVLSKVIEERKGDFVIAAGGGTPVYHDGLKRMKNAGLVVYLRADVDLLVDRLYHDRNKRPLISTLENNMRQILDNILEYRSSTFEQADLIVDASNAPADIVNQIIGAVQNKVVNQ